MAHKDVVCIIGHYGYVIGYEPGQCLSIPPSAAALASASLSCVRSPRRTVGASGCSAVKGRAVCHIDPAVAIVVGRRPIMRSAR